MRQISTEGLRAPEALAPGAAPRFAWLPIAALVVDDRYQRPITEQGRRQVRLIAEEFRWAHFLPLLVARGEEASFIVIDGQHRATAALLAGFQQVPCQIVEIDLKAQAFAFDAVNGASQRVPAYARFFARLASGDAEAGRTVAAAKEIGLQLLRYPVQRASQRPRQTMAATTLQKCIARHGAATCVTALGALAESASGEEPGRFNAVTVEGVVAALAERPAWLADRGTLVVFFDGVDFDALLRAARRFRVEVRGFSTAECFAVLLRERLDKTRPERAAA